jgi:hypothetical protein
MPGTPESQASSAPPEIAKPVGTGQQPAKAANSKRVRAPVKKSASAPRKRTVKASSANDLKSPY